MNRNKLCPLCGENLNAAGHKDGQVFCRLIDVKDHLIGLIGQGHPNGGDFFHEVIGEHLEDLALFNDFYGYHSFLPYKVLCH